VQIPHDVDHQTTKYQPFPDSPAPVIRNTDSGIELAMIRWGMPPPPRTGGRPVTTP
jgi:putative SOS response-associated peptidase YedK